MPGSVVVVGASAGGVEALKELIAGLPPDLGAPVLVVLHMWAQGRSYLREILAAAGRISVVDADNDAPLEAGRVYVAQPDRHLMVQRGHVHLSDGPKENRHRPSINTLFRSAALAYGKGAIGVLLTGVLDDGTVGLWEIKRRNGVAIVQDPAEAMFPDMPSSAMEHVSIDFVVKLAQMGPLLHKLVEEAELAQSVGQEAQEMSTNSDPTDFTCPECHGAIREARYGTVLQFQCRVGHTFSAETMIAAHNDAEENAIWTAVVSIEEGAELMERLARNSPGNGMRFAQEAERRRRHAVAMRDILNEVRSRRG